MRRPTLITLLGLILVLGTTPRLQAQELPSPDIPLKWIQLLDANQVHTSWTEAAQYFQSAITEQEWQRNLTAYRQPLGKVLSRTLQHTTQQTSLPGMPNGPYALFYYRSRFERKDQAGETLVMIREPDHRWKAVGYTIQ